MTGKRPPVRLLWQVFSTMLFISTFTFGGGFVIVSLMKRKMVDEKHWLTEEEMLDMTAIAQASPGAIAVNAAILAGRRIAGTLGLAAAVLGTILPPMVILGVISLLYAQFAANEWVQAALCGMQAGVAAVISDVVMGLGGKVVRSREWVSITLMVAAFVAACVLRVGTIPILVAALVVGAARAFFARKGAKKAC